MQRESAALIWHALDAARAIATFIDRVPLETYLDDLLRRRAVEREFEEVQAAGLAWEWAPGW